MRTMIMTVATAILMASLVGCNTPPSPSGDAQYPIDHGRIDPVTHEVPNVIRP